MFNKNNNPLVETVKAVMKQNEVHRQAEAALNEELGISSKRALPHEYHAQYDALLEAKRNKVGKEVRTNAEKLVDRFHAKRDAKRDVRAANKDNRPPSMEEEASNRATEGAMKSFLRRKAASKRAERENMSESVIAEIRENLEANLMAIHESGDDELFENYVNSLTEEELEILGLNESDPTTTTGLGRVAQRNEPGPAGGSAADKFYASVATRQAAADAQDPAAGGNEEAAAKAAAARNAATPRPATPRPAPTAQARPQASTAAPERSPFGDNTSGGNLSSGGRDAGYRTPPSQARGAARTAARTAPAARPPTASRPARSAAPERNPFTMSEQVKPNDNRSLQIKESLESFVRNRFLKG